MLHFNQERFGKVFIIAPPGGGNFFPPNSIKKVLLCFRCTNGTEAFMEAPDTFIALTDIEMRLTEAKMVDGIGIDDKG